MFADYFTIKIGGTPVKGRRLTVREIRGCLEKAYSGNLSIEESVAIIREHVTLEDGSVFDPEDLTHSQIKDLISELVLPKEGRGISDFIGLLC